MALLKKAWLGEDDAAREDIDSIYRYFVYLNVFDEFIDSNPKIRVILGRKGIGKSTLVKWAASHIEESDAKAIVCSIKGSDIYRFKTQDDSSNAYGEVNQIIDSLSSLINFEIAKRIGFALKPDDIDIVHQASSEGKIRRDPISYFLDHALTIFQEKLKLHPSKGSIKDAFEMFKRGERKVWIFADDLEYDYRDNEEYNSFLRSFFTACNQLCSVNKHVRFRVVLRPDVWANIEPHADIGSKLRGQILHIEWKRNDFKEFLFRRIPDSEIYDDPVSSSIQESILEPYFPKNITWADRTTSLHDIIFSYSDRRPRWALDLLRESIDSAEYYRKTTLDESCLKSALPRYSNSRLIDLSSEFSHECAQILSITRTFIDKPNKMTSSDLISHIQKHIIPLHPIINDSKADLYEIGNFLVRIGFLLQRTILDDSYMHVEYDDKAKPFNADSINRSEVLWEINLCFREAMNTKGLSISLGDRSDLRSEPRRKFSRKRAR